MHGARDRYGAAELPRVINRSHLNSCLTCCHLQRLFGTGTIERISPAKFNFSFSCICTKVCFHVQQDVLISCDVFWVAVWWKWFTGARLLMAEVMRLLAYVGQVSPVAGRRARWRYWGYKITNNAAHCPGQWHTTGASSDSCVVESWG